MSNTRGLTLLEVLLALVLMSAFSAAALPLFVETHRALRAPAPEASTFELARTVDRILEARSKEPFADLASVAWPANPEREPIAVELRREKGADHAWLLFRWREFTLLRYEAIEGAR